MGVIKETEPETKRFEDQALQEVEGYIERVEKQVETKKPGLLKSSQQTVAPVQVSDDQGNIVMQAAQGKQDEVKIVLPMDEEEIKKGLHHKVWEAIRWLAEWCVFIIKKYPGRVFYKQ